jgi:4,5-DOPA dioxygenase extradiol
MSIMPVVFVGHGNPMNALSQNEYSRLWAELGQTLPRPRAVLAISAHWYVPGTRVTAMAQPATIHDFGGFPEELYRFEYPAPGAPEIAERVGECLAPLPAGLDMEWGLDHGTWAVLCHVFPNADVPVLQLSVDRRQPTEFHYSLGRKLAPLREEGVLIFGSGNVVHNLRAYAWGQEKAQAFDWALRFENYVRDAILQGRDSALVHYEEAGNDAKLSVPTPEHYLPLLYVVGARREHEPVSFPVDGVDGGSVSMLSVRIG